MITKEKLEARKAEMLNDLKLLMEDMEVLNEEIPKMREELMLVETPEEAEAFDAKLNDVLYKLQVLELF